MSDSRLRRLGEETTSSLLLGARAQGVLAARLRSTPAGAKSCTDEAWHGQREKLKYLREPKLFSTWRNNCGIGDPTIAEEKRRASAYAQEVLKAGRERRSPTGKTPPDGWDERHRRTRRLFTTTTPNHPRASDRVLTALKTTQRNTIVTANRTPARGRPSRANEKAIARGSSNTRKRIRQAETGRPPRHRTSGISKIAALVGESASRTDRFAEFRRGTSNLLEQPRVSHIRSSA